MGSVFMKDKLSELTELFCKHGGKFENMKVGNREESGYYCSVIDSHYAATVYCPANLLVDIDDAAMNRANLDDIFANGNLAADFSGLNVGFNGSW